MLKILILEPNEKVLVSRFHAYHLLPDLLSTLYTAWMDNIIAKYILKNVDLIRILYNVYWFAIKHNMSGN